MNYARGFPLGNNSYGGALLPGYDQNGYPVYIQAPVPLPQQGSSNANPYADYLTCGQRQFQPCRLQSNEDLFSPMSSRSKISFGFSIEQFPGGLHYGSPRVINIGPQQAQPVQPLPLPSVRPFPPIGNDYSSGLTFTQPPSPFRPMEIEPTKPENGIGGKFVWPGGWKGKPEPNIIRPVEIPFNKPKTGIDGQFIWPGWNRKPEEGRPAVETFPRSFQFPKKFKLFKSPKRLQDTYGLGRHKWRLDQKIMVGENETKRLFKRELLERRGFKRPLKDVCLWHQCPKKKLIRKRPWMTLGRPIRSPSILSPRSVRDRSPIVFPRSPQIIR